jgi:hypothetical protein
LVAVVGGVSWGLFVKFWMDNPGGGNREKGNSRSPSGMTTRKTITTATAITTATTKAITTATAKAKAKATTTATAKVNYGLVLGNPGL